MFYSQCPHKHVSGVILRYLQGYVIITTVQCHRHSRVIKPIYSCVYVSNNSVSADYCGPKIGKLKKYTVHKFKNARQARTGRNMFKSSIANAPST
jgi:hypothetical protein